MKVTELRLGDYVYSTFSNKPCKVIKLESSPEGYGSVCVDGVSGRKDVASLTPIPLTAEILEKNGWEREGGVSRWHSDEHIVTILHWNADRKEVQIYTRGSRHLYDVMLNIKYVHELQHALRLCGIEKEIVL